MQCTPPLSIEQRSYNRFLVNADFFKVDPTLGPQSLDSLKEYLCGLSGLLPGIAIQMATNSSGEGGVLRGLSFIGSIRSTSLSERLVGASYPSS